MRSIHISPDIIKDARINRMSQGAELMFVHLLLKIDGLGYCTADPDRLRRRLFPKRDEVNSEQVRTWLDEIHAAGLIKFLTVEGVEELRVREYVDDKPRHFKGERPVFAPEN